MLSQKIKLIIIKMLISLWVVGEDISLIFVEFQINLILSIAKLPKIDLIYLTTIADISPFIFALQLDVSCFISMAQHGLLPADVVIFLGYLNVRSKLTYLFTLFTHLWKILLKLIWITGMSLKLKQNYFLARSLRSIYVGNPKVNEYWAMCSYLLWEGTSQLAMIFVANDQAKLWLILHARGYYSYLPLFHMRCTWRKCIAYGSTCPFLMSPKVTDRSSHLLVTWPSESLHGTIRILQLFSQVFSANSNFRQVMGKCNNVHVCPPGPGDMILST